MEEVQHHNKADSLWVVIDGDVYDVTKFQRLHPGGTVPFLEVAGKDATEEFYGLHRSEVLQNPRFARLRIGSIDGKPPPKVASLTPFAEAHGFWRRHSPYYNQSHHRFRAALREFVDREIRPDSIQNDEEGNYPSQELSLKMGEAGIIASLFAHGRADLLKALGFATLPGGLAVDDFDDFHELIFAEEMKRIGTYGLADGLYGGTAIGGGPVLKFGSKWLVEHIAPPLIRGEKRMALCITEPYGGSDVAGVHATAEKTADGKHWIITGVKKWITGGMFADWFTNLCKTKTGHTMIVLPRESGVVTKPIKTSYSAAAGTSYVEFINCKVPLEYTVGKEGNGFFYAMANFNRERWGMVASGNRMSRLMVEECFKWAMQRKVFGKRLIDQPVIRFKLGQMAAEVESIHSWLEDVTYQMTKMTPKEESTLLAGPIAMLKYQQTRVATLVSDNACQIFGGRALTRSGMGQMVEKFQRSFKMQAILGGSEEIMLDLAVRQAIKHAGTNISKL